MKRRESKTNLQVLGRSRKPPAAGDVFAMKPERQDYYFGLVVNPRIQLVGLDGSIMGPDWDGGLVYVFDQHSPSKDKVPKLDLNRLLVAPLILHLHCWRAGYVETVASVELTSEVVFPQHCFRRASTETYVNEHGEPVSSRTEPCGIYGLTPSEGFDDEISKALGIPLAPD